MWLYYNDKITCELYRITGTSVRSNAGQMAWLQSITALRSFNVYIKINGSPITRQHRNAKVQHGKVIWQSGWGDNYTKAYFLCKSWYRQFGDHVTIDFVFWFPNASELPRNENEWCGLTDLHLDKMAAVSQTIFSDGFSWMKSSVFWLKFHWSLFPRVQLTITQHWFRWWLGAD